ncbi:MAG: hypothetical protein JXR96_17325 [Deltaproteobacteria bacterium]|nr:hypothetical protein [Deltaproteobacteria bacterium]
MSRCLLFFAIAAGVLCAGALALANGYGDAKALIDQADEKLAGGRQAEAIALLKRVLTIQTATDRKRGKYGYGYAACAHLRLAKIYLARKNRKLARREVKLALALAGSQRFVEPGYLVLPTDPFIVEHFPKLGGLKSRKIQGRILKWTIGLIEQGGQVYALGSSALQRVDRTAGRVTTLYQQSRASLYRVRVHTDNKRMLLAYEGDPDLVYLECEPFAIRKLKSPGLPAALYFDRRAEHAIVYRGHVGSELAVYRLPLAGGKAEKVFSGQGLWLYRSGEHLIYARRVGRTFSYIRGIGRNPQSDRLVAHDLESGESRTLFSFSEPDTRSWALAMRSHAENRTALYVRDAARRTRHLLLHDWHRGQTDRRELDFGPEDGLELADIAFSPKDDFLVFLQIEDGRARIVRLDVESGAKRELSVRLPAPKDGKRYGLYGLGVLADNRTIWLHVDDRFYLCDEQGRLRGADLVSLSGLRAPEWAGTDHYFDSPEQLFLGVERGGSRVFTWLDMDAIRSAARPL